MSDDMLTAVVLAAIPILIITGSLAAAACDLIRAFRETRNP